MRRLLIVLGCAALFPTPTLTSAAARSSTYMCTGGGDDQHFAAPVDVHDPRDNRNHSIVFEVIDTATPRPDGCHHVFRSRVFVATPASDNNGLPPIDADNGPPFDGATLKLRVWVCGARHPEFDISYVSGSSNDATSPPTRDLNYGNCDPQGDNYGSEAHAQAWTPKHSVSSYATTNRR
jgi:hypothetical protein